VKATKHAQKKNQQKKNKNLKKKGDTEVQTPGAKRNEKGRAKKKGGKPRTLHKNKKKRSIKK